jgi:hypothetical protein
MTFLSPGRGVVFASDRSFYCHAERIRLSSRLNFREQGVPASGKTEAGGAVVKHHDRRKDKAPP